MCLLYDLDEVDIEENETKEVGHHAKSFADMFDGGLREPKWKEPVYLCLILTKNKFYRSVWWLT